MMSNEALRVINQIAAEYGLFTTRMPRFRYWTIPKRWTGTRYVFGWTTERDRHDKFYAFKYRVLRNGDWKLVKKVAFAKRRIAKARSLRWHNRHYRKPD